MSRMRQLGLLALALPLLVLSSTVLAQGKVTVHTSAPAVMWTIARPQLRARIVAYLSVAMAGRRVLYATAASSYGPP
jgi:hypothetical protein